MQSTAQANAYVERFIGSVRRECLDHVIVFSAMGLQRLMNLYCAYYQRSRTHLSLDKDAPIPRPIAPPGEGRVVAIPQVGASTTDTTGVPPDRTLTTRIQADDSSAGLPVTILTDSPTVRRSEPSPKVRGYLERLARRLRQPNASPNDLAAHPERGQTEFSASTSRSCRLLQLIDQVGHSETPRCRVSVHPKRLPGAHERS